MNLARFTVRRPVFTVMAVLIVMILGGIAFWRLPVDLMPDITSPTLSVSATYKNANPEEIEQMVTRPLEEALSAVPGVEEVSSTSTEGQASLRLTFAWGTDLDVAANDVRDRIDRVLSRLPDDVDRPMLRKFDLASFPVLILGASSDLDPISMRKLIEDQVKFRIERIPGVAALDIWGGLEREIHVDLDLERLRAYDLALDQVLARIRQGNVERPAGTVRQGHLDIRVRVPGYFSSMAELRDTVVMERSGVPVLLSDLAEVRDAWEKPTRLVRVNGRSGLRLSINKQSGANTVAVAQAALEEIARINQDLPQINIVPIIDSSTFIQRSISNLGMAAIFGGVLAVLVLLCFLHDLRSTLVIAAAIPVSIIATFAMVFFSGYTLNIMTLGGLALGVGMLVDNAIVVLENIVRLRGNGQAPAVAAVDGSDEVSSAIVASTLTTLVVFLPMVFVQGMAGVMFKQLAMVVSFALLCSLAAAVTLVPMLASRWLRGITAESRPIQETPRLFARAGMLSVRLMTRAENFYERILHAALDRKAVVIGGAFLLMIGSLFFIPLIGTELMPETDEGEVRIEGEMEAGARLEVMEKTFIEVENVVRREVPEMESMVVSLGGNPWRATGSHNGQVRINLKPLAQRSRSSNAIADDLRRKLAHIRGITLRPRAGQGLFIMRMGSAGGEKVSVELRGHDFDVANDLAQQVCLVVERTPGVTDARISREAGTPEERILVDRRKAADLGLTVEQIALALETALGGTSAGYYREDGDEYRILVKSTKAEEQPLAQLLDIVLISRAGLPVVLRNVVRSETSSGPVMIERQNQERIITVSANISGRDMGSVIADIRAGLRSVAVPRGFSIAFGGDYEEQQKAFRELLFSLGLAVLLVYMVMACQFESLRDPLVVMFSVPMAIVGVIVMLLLTGTTFNIQSFIGCIMLAGIVVNNAILLVDHTNLLRRRDRMELRAAIAEAGRRRLRPILMTALTTSLGLAPLAIGLGDGGEAQAPMARAVIGGLFSATLVTLVLVPIIYFVFEKHRSKPQVVGHNHA